MELEIFLVSAIYWISVLVVLAWLNGRVSSLRERLASLEAEGKTNEN